MCLPIEPNPVNRLTTILVGAGSINAGIAPTLNDFPDCKQACKNAAG